jgi:hypothetical protein
MKSNNKKAAAKKGVARQNHPVLLGDEKDESELGKLKKKIDEDEGKITEAEKKLADEKKNKETDTETFRKKSVDTISKIRGLEEDNPEKNKSKIDELKKDLGTINELANKYKLFKRLEDFDKCDPKEKEPCKSEDVKKDKKHIHCTGECKGKCKCEMFVQIVSGGTLFYAKEVQTEGTPFFKISGFSYSCYCITNK